MHNKYTINIKNYYKLKRNHQNQLSKINNNQDMKVILFNLFKILQIN